MSFFPSLRRECLQVSACLLVAGCVSHHPSIPVTLSATDSVNPDSEGQPAPIVTRIYQLAAKDRFMVADPIQLIQHDAQTLGDDEIGRDEFILQPGDKHEITLPANDKVHFVGIVAAYRAIDQDDWRELVPVPDGRALGLEVTVGATGLRIKNTAEQ